MAIVIPENDLLILVDAHVHVYDCFDAADLLDTAHRNFSAEASHHGYDKRFQGVLLLSEASHDHWYQRVCAAGEGEKFGQWRVSPTESDRLSLRAYKNTGESLLLIPGRQIVSSEGLEVLALFTDQWFEDGDTVEQIIDQVQGGGALPVLPWGAGKWLGSRGAIVRRVIQEHSDHTIFLGDNGGRPFGWPEPVQFKEAAEAGIRVLPGSDPLPISREVSRVGSFGFGINAVLASEPVASLREYLQNPDIEIFSYGRLEQPMRFLRNQLSIRMGHGK